jgi:hypothetical protein
MFSCALGLCAVFVAALLLQGCAQPEIAVGPNGAIGLESALQQLENSATGATKFTNAYGAAGLSANAGSRASPYYLTLLTEANGSPAAVATADSENIEAESRDIALLNQISGTLSREIEIQLSQLQSDIDSIRTDRNLNHKIRGQLMSLLAVSSGWVNA